VLKPAADGVTVQDAHDRNPVTGDGMPALSPSWITDMTRRKQQQQPPASTPSGMFTSQFVIADDLGAPPADSDDVPVTRRRGKRPSDAHVRMFESPRNPITDFGDDTEQNGDDEQQQQPSSAEKSTASDINARCERRRRLQPAHKIARETVVAWGKLNGNKDDETCYIGDPPMIRRAAARDARGSPITGYTVARAKSADAIQPAVAVHVDDFVVRDGSSYPARGGVPALDADYDGDDDDDDDDDNDTEEDEDEADDGVAVDRRRSA